MTRLRAAAALLTASTLVAIAVLAGVAPAAPAGTVVIDAFNRADGGLGVTESGQAWTAWSGAGSVVSQQANAPVGGYVMAVVDSGTATGAASITVSAPSSEFW